jgi:hypothetical protein
MPKTLARDIQNTTKGNKEVKNTDKAFIWIYLITATVFTIAYIYTQYAETMQIYYQSVS